MKPYHGNLKRDLCGLNLLDQFATRHKVIHGFGFPNFLKGLLFNKNTTDMAKILQSLSYKECSVISAKFITFGVFILILITSPIMDQTACCCDVTTS